MTTAPCLAGPPSASAEAGARARTQPLYRDRITGRPPGRVRTTGAFSVPPPERCDGRLVAPMEGRRAAVPPRSVPALARGGRVPGAARPAEPDEGPRTLSDGADRASPAPLREGAVAPAPSVGRLRSTGRRRGEVRGPGTTWGRSGSCVAGANEPVPGTGTLPGIGSVGRRRAGRALSPLRGPGSVTAGAVARPRIVPRLTGSLADRASPPLRAPPAPSCGLLRGTRVRKAEGRSEEALGSTTTPAGSPLSRSLKPKRARASPGGRVHTTRSPR